MRHFINNKKKIRFSTDDLKGVLCSTRKARGFRIREFWVKINYDMYNCDTSISLR